MKEICKVEQSKFRNGGVLLDVSPPRLNVVYENVPVLRSHRSLVERPRDGDLVIVGKLTDNKRVIEDVLTANESITDPIKEGEMMVRLDSNTALYFERQDDETYDILIESSGDISLEAAGDFQVDADGDISIVTGGTFEIDSGGYMTLVAGGVANIESSQRVSLNSQSEQTRIDGIDFASHTHDYPENNSDSNQDTTDPPN